MALTIVSPTIPNIADNTTSLSVTYSGALGGAGYYTILDLRINGVEVSSVNTTGSSGTVTIPVAANVANIYTQARNNTINTTSSNITGIVSVRATNFDSLDNPIGTVTTSSGNLTINYRIPDFQLRSPNAGNAINLDLADPVNLISNFSRPAGNSFFGRITGYVYNAGAATYQSVFSRYGFTGNSSWDLVSYGYKNNMVNAMNQVSPANFRTSFVTQWFGGGSYQNLPNYTNGVSAVTNNTVTSAVTYTFVNDSTATFNAYTINAATTSIPYTISQGTTGTNHEANLYLNASNGTPMLIASNSLAADVLTGTFTFTPNTATLLGYLPTSNNTSTFINLATIKGAYNSGFITQTPGNTATVDATYVTTIDNFLITETNTSISTLMGDATYVRGLSNIRFQINATASCGATIANQSITLSSFSGFNNAGNYIYLVPSFTGPALTATANAVDTRGRFNTATNSSVRIVDYSAPTVSVGGFDIYRTTNTGVVNALGNYAVARINAAAFSTKNSTNIEKNNLFYELAYRESGSVGAYQIAFPNNSAAGLTANLTTSAFRYNATTDFDLSKSYEFVLKTWDNYSSNTVNFVSTNDILPYGQVAMMLGSNYISVGKIWTQGALDVGGSIYADADVNAVNIAASNNINAANINASTSIKRGTNTVWDAGNDGSGSGLDADTLDTYHASDFSRLLATGSTSVNYSGFTGTEYYEKYSDGVLIKYGALSIASLGITTSRGGGAYYTTSDLSWTWDTDNPAFTVIPSVEISPKNNVYFAWPMRNIINTTTVQWNLSAVFSVSARAFEISYTARGRWD